VAPRAQLQLDSLQGPIKQLTSLVSKEILVFVEVFNKPKQQKKKAAGAGRKGGREGLLKADGQVSYCSLHHK